MDLERSTTVGMGADAAFAVLADPLRIPEYVPLVTHVDSTAEDGTEPAPASARETRFFADATARVVEWGEAGAAYSGSMTIEPGTASTSQLTIRLHVRDDADRARTDAFMDQAARNLRRILSGR